MKTFFKTTILALLLAVMSPPALAEWVLDGRTGNGADDFDQYVDLSTIRRKGDRVKMWELKDYKAPQVKPWGTFRSMKSQSEHDCAEEETRSLAGICYSGPMGSGSVVFSGGEGEWLPIAPGTVSEALWKIACGKIKRK